MEVKGQTWCSRAGRVAWGFQDLDLPYRPSLPGHPAPQGHGHRILTQNEQDGRNKEKKALLCREVRWSPGPAWAGGVCPDAGTATHCHMDGTQPPGHTVHGDCGPPGW